MRPETDNCPLASKPGFARPWLVAHRGASFEAPENTKAAFERALQTPIDGIEFDLQLTRDGIPVLYHNRTLFMINGRKKRIADYTCDQLREMDWGGWFDPRFAGEPLLTLTDALHLLHRRTRLLIEIKAYEPDRRAGRTMALTDTVMQTLLKFDPALNLDSIYLLCFDPQVLQRACRQAPDFNYVLTLLPKTDGPTSPAAILKRPAHELTHVRALCIQEHFMTAELIRFARGLDKMIMTYSCNTARQTLRALKLEADVIMTDKPAWLHRYTDKIIE